MVPWFRHDTTQPFSQIRLACITGIFWPFDGVCWQYIIASEKYSKWYSNANSLTICRLHAILSPSIFQKAGCRQTGETEHSINTTVDRKPRKCKIYATKMKKITS